MRIFIGLVEIAHIVDNYAKGFNALGHETLTMIWEQNPFYPSTQYDLVMDSHPQTIKTGISKLNSVMKHLKRRWFNVTHLRHLINSCDVFVFNFGTSLLPSFLDFPLLKRLGKKIITTFWGSDIRYWYAYQQEFQQIGLLDEVQPFIDYIKHREENYFRKLITVQAAEKHADLILSQPGYGQLQTRPYMRANVPIDLSQYKLEVPDRAIPIIVHAPSNRGVKGTNFILEAIEKLRGEGLALDFRLIENTPNETVRALLTESDIVIDELYSETIGLFSTEGMATGNAVLVRYQPEYSQVAPECPAVNVNKTTLANTLRQVILDRQLRQNLAYAGRPFVERHHDHNKVAKKILDWLDPGGIKKYDFNPTFYHSFHIPPEILKEELKYKWQSYL